jgi:excisionase family DNA binding protein
MTLPYLTTSQAAERAGVSIRTIQRMIERKDLPCESVGKEALISIGELDAAFARMSQVPKVGRAAPQMKLDYWKTFAALLEWQGFRPKAKPQSEQWLAFGIAPGCRVAAHIRVNQGLIGVDLTLGSHAKIRYSELVTEKEKIEHKIGEKIGEKITLEWHERPNNAESWVLVRKESDVTDRLLWSAQHYWLSERFRAFYDTFKPVLTQSQR